MRKPIYTQIINIFLGVVIFLGSAFPALAQQDDGSIWAAQKMPEGTVNCSDYYKFQSVQINAGTNKNSFSPGEFVEFSGLIENENAYPVVDGNVFVRIGMVNPENVSEGNFLVDEFFGAEKVVLDANEKKSVAFRWNIPQSAVAGEYQADFFFSVGRKFNLGGLPFSNEVIVGFATFYVDSSNSGGVRFDRSATKVNGEAYAHIGNWPSFKFGDKVVVNQPILNMSEKEVKVDITYELYFWDSLKPDDKLSTKNESIVIPAGETRSLEYSIDKFDQAVYYLKIIAQGGDQKSIVNARLIGDSSRPRLNYPAINKFPLNSGDDFTLFTCFHSASYSDADGIVSLILTDKDGSEVGRSEYSGTIRSSMAAVKKDLVSDKDYDYLKLKAEIKDKRGNVVDSYEAEYDCSLISGGKSNKCHISSAKEKRNIIWIIGFIVTLAMFAIVLWRRGIKRRAMLLLLMIVFLFPIFKADAFVDKTGTVSGAFNISFDYAGASDHCALVGSSGGAGNPLTLNYSYRLDNDTVQAGSDITFTDNSTGSFLAVGGPWDTPNIVWCNATSVDRSISGDNKPNSMGGCSFVNANWQELTDTSKGNKAYISWSVARSDSSTRNVTVTSNNNSVVDCSSGSWSSAVNSDFSCQAKRAGTARITINTGTPTARLRALVEMNHTGGSDRGSVWITEDKADDVGEKSPSHINDTDCSGSWSNTMTLGSRNLTFDVTVTPQCGNGEQENGESCDDGNVTAGDGCDETCQLEPGSSISANPLKIGTIQNNTTTVSWSSTNATSCRGWGNYPIADWPVGSRALSGSRVATIYQNTTFNIGCWNDYNPQADSFVDVEVVPAPTAWLTATPAISTQNSSINLNWDSSNTDYCWSWARYSDDPNYRIAGYDGFKPLRGLNIPLVLDRLGEVNFYMECGRYGDLYNPPSIANSSVRVVPAAQCSVNFGKAYADINDPVQLIWTSMNDADKIIEVLCDNNMIVNPSPLPTENGSDASATVRDSGTPQSCTLTVINEANTPNSCTTIPGLCIREWVNPTCGWTTTSACADNVNCGKRSVARDAWCQKETNNCSAEGGTETRRDFPLSDCGAACVDYYENCPPCGQNYQETN